MLGSEFIMGLYIRKGWLRVSFKVLSSFGGFIVFVGFVRFGFYSWVVFG